MNEFFVPGLYLLAGATFFAFLHHGLIAFRYPIERYHLIFVALCLLVSFYTITRAAALTTNTPGDLVFIRRLEFSFGMLFFSLFPWFIAEYSGFRLRWLLVLLSAMFMLVFFMNLLLPYTAAYTEIPEIHHYLLPWGEKVADLKPQNPTVWFSIGWLGILTVFILGLYSCVSLYRRGFRRKSNAFLLALGFFIATTLINLFINLGLIDFIYVAEIGFIALVIVMSIGLTRNLQISELRMRAVLDNIPAVVYTKDILGRYLFINREFEKLFHISNEEAAGKKDHDLFPPAQAEQFRANDEQVLKSRKTIQSEETARISGINHDFLSIKFPVMDTDGFPIAICGISTDVTETHKTNEELDLLRRQVWHADRVLRTGVMTASLAHELSQPLAAILCNAQAGLRFINRGTPDLEELGEILNDIARDDKRAATIIKGLRAMLRQQETEREIFDLGECVHELLELMHTEFIERRIECESDIEPGCNILADRVQVQQVLLNIILNAMEAMSDIENKKRHLKIRVSRSNDSGIRVTIRDSGIGVPDDKLGRIFDGYYTTKDKGLGIGLAMCRTIVELHSGRIWIQANDDWGVTVFISLPAVTANETVNQVNN